MNLVMAYEKPKCECGDELAYWSQPIYTRIMDITKRGKLAKKEYLSYDDEYVWARLRCFSCDSEYWIEYDEKERLIRGDEYNP